MSDRRQARAAQAAVDASPGALTDVDSPVWQTAVSTVAWLEAQGVVPGNPRMDRTWVQVPPLNRRYHAAQKWAVVRGHTFKGSKMPDWNKLRSMGIEISHSRTLLQAQFGTSAGRPKP